MRQDQQRKLDSLLRVRDFVRTQPEAVRALEGSPALKQLEDAIAAIGGHGTTQGSADRSIAGHISRQRAIGQELIRRYITPIAKFARAKLRGAPDYAALTFSPSAKRAPSLMQGARSMAQAAAPYADALAMAGFPADTIAKFNATIDAFADAIGQRGHYRVVRVGSTKGIEQQLVVGREAVKLLDAVISGQFSSDQTFLAAWKSASRVDLKSGGARKESQATAPEATA